MRIIRFTLGTLLAVAAAAFAIANRQSVDVIWSPFHDPLHAPLYLVVLGFSAFTFLLGAALVWLNTLTLRYAARRQSKQIKTLEKRLGEEDADISTSQTGMSLIKNSATG